MRYGSVNISALFVIIKREIMHRMLNYCFAFPSSYGEIDGPYSPEERERMWLIRNQGFAPRMHF